MSVDTDMYDLKWEINSHEAMMMLYGGDWSGSMETKLCRNQSIPTYSSSSSLVRFLDLRSSEDFSVVHISGAMSTPLGSLTAATVSPFDDVQVLEMQWRDLKHKLSSHEFFGQINLVSGPVILACYHGETARLACSIMRAQNIEAYSIKGGMSAVIDTAQVDSNGGKFP